MQTPKSDLIWETDDQKELLQILQSNLSPVVKSADAACKALKTHFVQANYAKSRISALEYEASELRLELSQVREANSKILDLFGEHDSLENCFTKAKLMKQQMQENQLSRDYFYAYLDAGLQSKSYVYVLENEVVVQREQFAYLYKDLFRYQESNYMLLARNSELDNYGKRAMERLQALQIAFEKTKDGNERLLCENEDLRKRLGEATSELERIRRDYAIKSQESARAEISSATHGYLLNVKLAQLTECLEERAYLCDNLTQLYGIAVSDADGLRSAFNVIKNDTDTARYKLQQIKEENYRLTELNKDYECYKENIAQELAVVTELKVITAQQFGSTDEQFLSVMRSAKANFDEIAMLRSDNQRLKLEYQQLSNQNTELKFTLQYKTEGCKQLEDQLKEAQMHLLETYSTHQHLESTVVSQDFSLYRLAEENLAKSQELQYKTYNLQYQSISFEELKIYNAELQKRAKADQLQVKSLQERYAYADAAGKEAIAQLQDARAHLHSFAEDKRIFISLINRLGERVFCMEDLLQDMGSFYLSKIYKPDEYLQATAENYALVKETEALKTANAELQQRADEYYETLHYMASVAGCKTDRETVRKAMQETHADAAMLEQLKVGLEERVTAQALQLAQANAQCGSLAEKCNCLEKEHIELQLAMYQLGKAHSETLTELQNTQALLAQKTEYSAKLEEQQSQVQFSASQALKSSANFAYQKDSLQLRNERLEEYIAELSQQYEALGAYNERLTGALQQAKQEANALRSEKTEFTIYVNTQLKLDYVYSADARLSEVVYEIDRVMNKRAFEVPELYREILELRIQSASTEEQNKQIQGELVRLQDLRRKILIAMQLQSAADDSVILQQIEASLSYNQVLALTKTGIQEQCDKYEMSLKQLWQEMDRKQIENKQLIDEMSKLRVSYAETERYNRSLQLQADESVVFLYAREEELQLMKESFKETQISQIGATKRLGETDFRNTQLYRDMEKLGAKFEALRSDYEEATSLLAQRDQLLLQQKQYLNYLTNDKIVFITMANSEFQLESVFYSDAQLEDVGKIISGELRRRPGEFNDMQCKLSYLEAENNNLKQEIEALSKENIEFRYFDYKVSVYCNLVDKPLSDKADALCALFVAKYDAEYRNAGLAEICYKNELEMQAAKTETANLRETIYRLSSDNAKLQLEYANTNADMRALYYRLDDSCAVLQAREEEINHQHTDLQSAQLFAKDREGAAKEAGFLLQQSARELEALKTYCAAAYQRSEELKAQLSQATESLQEARRFGQYMRQQKIDFLTAANAQFYLEKIFDFETDLVELANALAPILCNKPSELLIVQEEARASTSKAKQLSAVNDELYEQIYRLRYFRARAFQALAVADSQSDDAAVRYLVQMAAEHAELSQQVAKQRELVSRYESLLSKAEQRVNDLEERFGFYNQENAELKQRCLESGVQIQTLGEELSNANALLVRKQEELQYYANAFEISRTEFMQSSRNAADSALQADQHRRIANDLYNQLKSCADELQHLQSEHQSVINADKNTRAMLLRFQQEKQEFIVFANDNFNLNQAFQSSDSLLDLAAVIAACLQALPAQIPALYSKISALEHYKSELQYQLEEKIVAVVALRQFQFDAYRVMQCAQDVYMSTATDALSRICAERAHFAYENIGLRELSVRYQQYMSYLTDALDVARAQNYANTYEISALKQTTTTLHREAEAIQANLDRSQLLLQQKAEENELSRADLERTRTEAAYSRRTSADATMQIKTLETANSELEYQSHAFQEQCLQLRSYFEALYRTSNGLREENRKLAEERLAFIIKANYAFGLAETFSNDDLLDGIAEQITAELKVKRVGLPELQYQVARAQSEIDRMTKENQQYLEKLTELDAFKRHVCRVYQVPHAAVLSDYLSDFYAKAERFRMQNDGLLEKCDKQSYMIAQLQRYLEEARDLNATITAESSLTKEQFVLAAKELETEYIKLNDAAKTLQIKEEYIAEIYAQARQQYLTVSNLKQQLASTDTALCQAEKQVQLSGTDIQRMYTQVYQLYEQLEQFYAYLNETRTRLSESILEKTNFIIAINGYLHLGRVFQSTESLEQVGNALISEVKRYPDVVPQLQQRLSELEAQIAAYNGKLSGQARNMEKLQNFKMLTYQILQIGSTAEQETALEALKKCYDARNTLELQVQYIVIENKKYKTLYEELSGKCSRTSMQLYEAQQERNKLVVYLAQGYGELQSLQSKLDQAYLTMQYQEEVIQIGALNATHYESKTMQTTNEVSHLQAVNKQITEELALKTELVNELQEYVQQLSFLKNQLSENSNKMKAQLKGLQQERMQFLVEVNSMELPRTFDMEDSLTSISNAMKAELKSNDTHLPKLQGLLKALYQENYKVKEEMAEVQRENKVFSQAMQQLKYALQVQSYDQLVEKANQLLVSKQELQNENSSLRDYSYKFAYQIDALSQKSYAYIAEFYHYRESDSILRYQAVELQEKLSFAERVSAETSQGLQYKQELLAKVEEQVKRLQQEASNAQGRAAQLELTCREQEAQLNANDLAAKDYERQLSDARKNLQAGSAALTAVKYQLADLVLQKQQMIDKVNNSTQGPRVYSENDQLYSIIDDLLGYFERRRREIPDLLEQSRTSKTQLEQTQALNESMAAEMVDLQLFKQQVQEMLRCRDIPCKNLVYEVYRAFNQLEQLQSQRELLDQRLAELYNVYTSNQAKIEHLMLDLASRDREILELQAKADRFALIGLEAQEKLDSSQKIMLDREERLQSRILAQSPAESTSKDELARLRVEVQRLQSYNGMLEQELALSRRRAQDHQSRLSDHDSSPPSAHTTYLMELQNEKKALEDQLRAAEQELKRQNSASEQAPDYLLSKLLELQEENTVLKATYQQVTQARFSYAYPEAERNLRRQSLQIEALTQKILEQQRLILELYQSAAYRYLFPEKLPAEEQHKPQLDAAQYTELYQMRAEYKALDGYLAAYNDYLASARAENTYLKATVQALQAALREAYNDLLDSQNRAQRSSDAETRELKSQLDAYILEIEAQKRRINAQTQRIADQQTQLYLSAQAPYLQLSQQSLHGIQQQVELITQQNYTLLTNMKRLADAISDADTFKSECFRQFGCYPDISSACRRCSRLRAMMRDGETRDYVVLRGRKCICIIGSSMYSFDLRVRKMKEFVDLLGDILM